MKKSYFLMSIVAFITFSCNPKPETIYKGKGTQAINESILRIENGLLPAGIIAGEPCKTFSIRDRMQYFDVPGLSIAVMKDHQIEWAKSYGVKEKGTNDSVTLNTMFQAASMSKPVTAMIALKLEEEKKINLEQDINQQLKTWHLPENEFTRQRAVTPGLLMLHLGGLNVPSFPGYSKYDSIPGVKDILNGTSPSNTEAVKVVLVPGSKWSYSGGGYTVLQLLMEEVSGKSFPKLMKDDLFDPLNLSNSTFEHNLTKKQQKSIAKAYKEDGKMVGGGYHIYPEKAAAGLWTTSMDYARMMIELEKSYLGEPGKIIRPETSRKMLKRYRGDMALGIVLKNNGDSLALAYGGWNEGYICDVYSYLKTGNGVVIMTNSNNGYMLIQEIYRSLATAYGWPYFKPATIKTVEVPSSVLSKYAGTFKALLEGNKEYTFDFVQKSDGLYFNDDGKSYKLYPVSETEFLVPDQDWRFKFPEKDILPDSVEFEIRFNSGTGKRIN
ncbi:MAG: serine hydrolase [Bacteroidetes bacterium]|nr:serine hydrolase [Bacteroidota bacterium]